MILLQNTLVSANASYIAFTGISPSMHYMLFVSGMVPSSGATYGRSEIGYFNTGVKLSAAGSVGESRMGCVFGTGGEGDSQPKFEGSHGITPYSLTQTGFVYQLLVDSDNRARCWWDVTSEYVGTSGILMIGEGAINSTFDEIRLAFSDAGRDIIPGCRAILYGEAI